MSMTQGDRAIAEGLAWFIGSDLPGLEHDETAMPEVAGPEGLPTMAERQRAAGIESPFRFWDNMENRPLRWLDDWPPPGPLPPVSESWFRFTAHRHLRRSARRRRPRSSSSSTPWAGPRPRTSTRGSGPLTGRRQWVAPSLDLNIRFHQAMPDSEHLFVRMEAPLAAGALITTEGRAWSQDGRLLASGSSQLLSTPVPPA